MSMSMLARQAANDHGNHAAITHDDRACSDNARGRSIVDLESVLEATMLRNAYGMLRAQEACACLRLRPLARLPPARLACAGAAEAHHSGADMGGKTWALGRLGHGKTWLWEDLDPNLFYFSTRAAQIRWICAWHGRHGGERWAEKTPFLATATKISDLVTF